MGANVHNDMDLSVPASVNPIPASDLPGLLDQAVEVLCPAEARTESRAMRVRYNALHDAAGKLTGYITDTGTQSVTIDEALLAGFDAFLVKNSVSDGQRRVYRNAVRNLINRFPAPLLQRPLMTLAESHRVNRFADYTPETQDAFDHFLREGRKLRKGSTHQNPVLSPEHLSGVLRKQIIDSTLTFLKQIEAYDIFAITEEDVEEYVEYHEQNDRKGTAYKVLDFIKPLFSNLRCRRLLKDDPLRLIPRQVSGINLDYVDQAGIDKLADLSTLNMNDFIAVRGRLLAFGLDYAYALRNRESSLVRCGDFLDVELRLPKSIQKIKKDTLPLYTYFPETSSRLMARYLELRTMKAPSTDILMISVDGKPLGASGCRQAVKDHCDSLGIKTHEGKTVTPHRLRHSLGTLNIEPLGISLGLVEIKEHLRHASIDMTYRVYITQNPLRSRIGYEKRMEKINGYAAPAEGKPVATVPAVPQPAPEQPDDMIDEAEAIRILKPLGLNFRSLRGYAMQAGKAGKSGRSLRFSSSFVADLAENHFTRTEALDLLKMPPSSFHAWTRENGVAIIRIGKASLFRKNVILEKRRAG